MGVNNATARGDSTIKESHITYHEEIGRGASGRVYRITWKSKEFGKIEAAAKKIPISTDNVIDEKLRNEIKFLQSLSHPNIITYYGHVRTSEHLVIVTEYATNGTLYDNLKNKDRLPTVLKIKWAIQAAKGIKYLQDKNILHRDIKSINLLIDSNDNLKICDFGIAKDLTSTKTTKCFKGSIKYMPPEAYKFTSDSKLSPKADIFAFGIVLWELDTCEEPYKGLSFERIMWLVGNDDYRPEIPATCPDALKTLIQECWDKDRETRPDAEGVIGRLDRYESSLQWQSKHNISTGCILFACHWVSYEHLAVCMDSLVKVYEVNAHTSKVAYQLSSDGWKERYTTGVAVSDSLPDSMLVICDGKPYVYEFPCHQATQEAKKYKIRGSGPDLYPYCIVANANTAAIGLIINHSALGKSFPRTIVTCSLPEFTHQTRVEISFSLFALSISTNNLLTMGGYDMILVKPLGNMSKDVCKIKPPDGWRINSVCFRNNDTEIYTACNQDWKGRVYRYRWDAGKSQYVNVGCVIDGISSGRIRCLSVTSYGLLACNDWGANVKVFSLE